VSNFRSTWLVDFEFHQPDGELPHVVCMVAREWYTKQTVRVWDGGFQDRPPYPIGSEDLFVAYYASAELGCFLQLGWTMPARILDLFTEFRCLTNGQQTLCGNSLLGALTYFGLGGMQAAEKDGMRQLAIRGGPFTAQERADLLDYCESDVVALDQLLTAMLPTIDVARALLRGRYMAAVSQMERVGVPIDVEARNALLSNWGELKGRLIREIDRDYRVFIPTGQSRIDRSTKEGEAVLAIAEELDLDPYLLASVSKELWKERQQRDELNPAIAAVRKSTGLTVNRIAKWEDSGKDHSSYPGLDVTARELAAEFSLLCIGSGYSRDDVANDTDHAGLLWDLLRQPNKKPATRYSPEVLHEAAEYVAEMPDDERYEQPVSFNAACFADWLIHQDLPWPRTPNGQLSLSDDSFRQMARQHPQVAPLRELRHSLGEMRLFSDLAVGTDGRNRCLLSPFRSITGRNQPSNAKFIFGPSCWLRGLIKPEPGRAVAYVDWSQQEFGIAAAMSGDAAMMEAYSSGDPYLTFAKQAGAVPNDATKQSHPAERDQFKVCALAVQYGMGSESLAESLNQPEAYARRLLKIHRETYPTFWKWSNSAVNHAMLLGWLSTVFGWTLRVGGRVNPRSLANFPSQANGAEMLRLACCLATERGIQVCAPIHDALLVEGSLDEIDDVVEKTQQAMAEASRVILDGFELRSDSSIVAYSDRYMDNRGERMWNSVMNILDEFAEVPDVPF